MEFAANCAAYDRIHFGKRAGGHIHIRRYRSCHFGTALPGDISCGSKDVGRNGGKLFRLNR